LTFERLYATVARRVSNHSLAALSDAGSGLLESGDCTRAKGMRPQLPIQSSALSDTQNKEDDSDRGRQRRSAVAVREQHWEEQVPHRGDEK
jgi:hypothetical protein